jgi:hypothetical protein
MQIQSTENWNNILYCGIVGFQLSTFERAINAIFFVVVMLIGNYMFMNLFISILLQGIDQDSDSGAGAGEADGGAELTLVERAALRARKALRLMEGGFRSLRVRPDDGEPPAAADARPMSPSREGPKGVGDAGSERCAAEEQTVLGELKVPAYQCNVSFTLVHMKL